MKRHTKTNKMSTPIKYYTLQNGKWSHNSQQVINLEGKKLINLYNDYLTFVGIGVY